MKPYGEFMMAPIATANESEGFTEIQYRMSQQPKLDLPGMKNLTINGGQGDGQSAVVGGQVKTIKKSVVTTVANEVIRDTCLTTGQTLAQLTLLQLYETVPTRVKGRLCDVGQVMAEIGRLQNQALAALE